MLSLSPTAASFSVRETHMGELLAETTSLPFIEVMADNFMALRGPHYYQLQQLAERYPVVLHCVGLSLGGAGPTEEYLKRLTYMANELSAIAISDHLSVSTIDGTDLHDLLPIRYDHRTLAQLESQIQRVQTQTRLPLLLENISRYLAYRDDFIDEGEMLAELNRRTDVGILLDINNLYVTAHNLDGDPLVLLKHFPLHAVGYCHLAGHERRQALLVDTHGCHVSEAVWQLFQQVLNSMGPKPTIIEWDNQIPPVATMLRESAIAERILQEANYG